MTNPLESYINLARLVFSVEPSDNWDEFEEFEEKLRQFHKSLLCKNCEKLLNDPCTPKKQHFSCQHRVCLDCIGKNRSTVTNCKMCRDFTLFEKSNPTKLVLRLFKELCELIKGSWIFDYIERRTNHDTGQNKMQNLIEIIDSGVNYGRNISILVEDSSSSASSSDENSNSSMTKMHHQHMQSTSSHTVPYNSQTFPNLSPLPPVSPNSNVQSPEQFNVPVLPLEPIQTSLPIVSTPSPAQNLTVSQIVQYSAPIVVQSQLPSTSKLASQPSQPLLKTSSFISHVPMRVKPTTATPISTKSIMSPMKIQQQQQHQSAPTIYSVMYTGSGNKITLKRKAPDEISTNEIQSTNHNVKIIDFISIHFLTY